MNEAEIAAFNAGVAAERARWWQVEDYLICFVDQSMSRNNSEAMAAEALEFLRSTKPQPPLT